MTEHKINRQMVPAFISEWNDQANSTFIERFFFNFYEDPIDGIEYLPIFWTSLYLSGKHREIENFLKEMKDGKYFVVCQHDDAPKEKLPNRTVVFNAGGKNKMGIPIPLLSGAAKINKNLDKCIFCSFVGHLTHQVRKNMFELFKAKYNIVVFPDWEMKLSLSKKNIFNETIQRSIFTLCPRGYGPTSFRLYEALEHGSIPVYIYDDLWLPYAKEIDWTKFIVAVHKNDMALIPDILKECDVVKMRQAYLDVRDKYFTPQGACEWIYNKAKIFSKQ